MRPGWLGVVWPTLVRLARAFRALLLGEAGGRAAILFAALGSMLLAINVLNVVNSYVGRDFMTAIEQRNGEAFVRMALLYFAVFGASTVVAVLHRFAEDHLGLVWREWLTARTVRSYLANRVYYRLSMAGELTNPDQRIAEDVRSFTTTALGFLLMFSSGLLTAIAFSGVLWSISPWLFAAAVSYATIGTFATIWLGRPLVRLQYQQSDREADLRADLIHVRENAESVALRQREGWVAARVVRRLDALVENTRRIIRVSRNVGFFTTAYNYGIQIVPALLVAPLYFRGEVEFGVITQSAMAFSQLLGAFSLLVTEFRSLSTFAAVLNRLNMLSDAVERSEEPQASCLEIAERDDALAFEALTLRGLDGRVLVRDLGVSIPATPQLVLVTGHAPARQALFHAVAGLWQAGEGRIERPGGDALMLQPERPYLPPGTLRELIVSATREAPPKVAIARVLSQLGVAAAAVRAGGLDQEHSWPERLSLGEQQLFAIARVALAEPRFALLDRPSRSLAPNELARALRVLAGRGVATLVFEDHGLFVGRHDAVLELRDDATWSFRRAGAVAIGE
jgi:putative ATP-binding cassette transporter